MRTLFIISALFLTVSFVKGQSPLSFYKAAADSVIFLRLDSSIYPQLLCNGFSIKTVDNKRWFSKNYESFRDEIVFPAFVTFDYAFFSSAIKHDVSFQVTVDKNKLVSDSDFVNIPRCILENSSCTLIHSDSAVKIALSDSIEYPNNLVIEFKQVAGKHKYYWVLTGYHPEKAIPKTKTKAILTRQQRVIDAVTGEIVFGTD